MIDSIAGVLATVLLTASLVIATYVLLALGKADR